MHGQSVSVPEYGWYVSFSVRTAIRDGSGDTMPLAAHLFGPSIASRVLHPQAPPSMSRTLPGSIADDLPPSEGDEGDGQSMMRAGSQPWFIVVEQRDTAQAMDVGQADAVARPGRDSNMIAGNLHLFVRVDGSALIYWIFLGVALGSAILVGIAPRRGSDARSRRGTGRAAS